ncbi:MAG TPA: acyl-CoA dehydrogenase family protein [Acidimicrobiales bacterium]|nr:acyl-CoA dehydrogenase family protein [Acidimicrobiales bacterium]
MDFELSPDQLALRDAAADLLAGRSPMPVVRSAVDRGGAPDRDLWEAMVDQGWCGLAVPEKLGGVGLGWVEAAIVLEEVGAHLAPAPVLGQMVALDALADGAWGPRLIAGEAVAACAERLDQPCVYAPAADVVVVPEDDRLMAIELGEHLPAAEPAMDLTRQLGWLWSAALADAPRIEVGGAAEVARHVDVAAVAYAAELLGVAQRALDLAVAYAKDRVQFGRPIGSFQAVKHRCADMLVDVEGMRSAVYWAAWTLGDVDRDGDAGDDERSIAASTAKAWCSDAALRVLASALQVHGGIGFTWEHDLHLYLKRGHLDAVAFGDATFHRTRLAQLLRSRVEGGQSVI